MIVDAHHHFWDPGKADYPWMTDEVAAIRRPFGPQDLRPLLEAHDRFGLSAREVEVLALIVDGASNREIADALCIVPGTVQDHVHSICTKSGAPNAFTRKTAV